MKPASGTRTLVLQLLILSLVIAPAAAQEACPRASGFDAEAGWTAYSVGDMTEARSHFAAALAHCPDDHYARTGLGYVELREGRIGSATSLWEEVVSAQPTNVDALTGLGLAAWRTGDAGAVRERFTRVLALAPDHPTALEYMDRLADKRAGPSEHDPADDAWSRGDTELALELYSGRLAHDPSDDVAALRVGLVRAWTGDHDGALELLDGILERDPGNVDARLARARVWAWSGYVARAQREVTTVLAAQPDNPEALGALAQFEAWSGDAERAIATYDQLTAIAPTSGAGARGRAQALAWSARYEASRAVYDSLLSSDPDDVEARLGLARMLAYRRDFTAAIAEYDRVLAHDPGEVRAWIGRARTLGWSGRLVAGEEVAITALGIDQSNADAWGVLGELYLWQGRNAAALEALETATRMAPTNGPVQDQLRAIRLTLAPAARPSVVYESDSDRNRMVTTSLSAGWHPLLRLDVRADAYFKDLQQGTFRRNARGAMVSARYQLEPGWLVTGAAGGTVTNGSGDPTLAEFRAGLRTPERHVLVASLDVSSVALNETAALAELGGRSTGVVLSARFMLTGPWRVDGALEVGRYEGSENNGRRGAMLAGSRRLGRSFSVGASLRGFSFEKNLNDGYFDPEFYGIGELTSSWQHRPLPWSFLVEVAPGVQQIGTDKNVNATLRSNTRLGYEIAPGREVSLSVGYSTAGLVSFATGDRGYRYLAFVLGTSWTF